MNPPTHNKHILLIDRQPYWREISTEALEKVGFAVGMLDSYYYPLAEKHGEGEIPDLVVLGCARIGNEEQQLIDEVLQQKHHLLVLCTSLSWQTMRMLFRQGVYDIRDKPYNPAKLIRIVYQTLNRTPFHDEYQAIENGGAA